MSYSLVVTLAGTVLGTIIGTVWLCPVLVNMFADWYIVPGLHAVFSRRIHLYSGACNCSLPVVVLCGKQKAFKGKTGRGTASGSAKAGETLYF